MSELSYKNVERRKDVKTGVRALDVFVVIICLCGFLFSLYLFQKDFFTNYNPLFIQQAGTVTVKYNNVQRRVNDRVVWDRLNKESPVYSGDLIRIARLSGAVLNIDNNSIELGENTLIRIQKDIDSLQINFYSGDINISSHSDSGAVQIAMGESIIEVAPGTEIKASSGEEGNVLRVTKGTAQVYSATGDVKEVPAGLMLVQDTQGEVYYPVDAVIAQRQPASLSDPNTLIPALTEQDNTNAIYSEPALLNEEEISAVESLSEQQQLMLSLLSPEQLSLLSEEQLEQLASMPLSELLRFALIPGEELSQMSAQQIQREQQERQEQREREERLARQAEQARQAEAARAAQAQREREERQARQAEQERQAQQARISRQQWQEEQARRAAQEQAVRQEQAERERQMQAARAQEEREIQEQITRQAQAERERQERITRQAQETEIESYAQQEQLTPEQIEQIAALPPFSPPADMKPVSGTVIGAQELRQRKPIEFSWAEVEGANAYILTIYKDAVPRRQQIFQSEPADKLYYNFTDFSVLEDSGAFTWQVEAVFFNDEKTIIRRGNPGQNSFTLDVPRPGRVRPRDAGVMYGRY